MWRGGCRLSISVAASFVWRCLSGSAMAPFPHPAHRTGHADLPHPALGQNFTPSPTTRRAQAGIGVRARSARRDAAARHNVPFAAVRVLADPSHRRLPHVAQVAVLGNGRLDFSAIARSLATKPRQWGDVIRTAFDTRKAHLVLRQSRALIGVQFGLASQP